MNEWWAALAGIEQVFYGFAIVGSTVFVVSLLGQVFGLFGGDMDAECDVDAGEADAGVLKLFSVKSLVAFFTMFGWTGVVMLAANPDVSLVLVFVSAFGAGTGTGAAVAYMLSKLTGLQASGNITLKNAVGELGDVYLRIPENFSGAGKITLTLQGRFRELNAYTHGKALERKTRVVVIDVNGEDYVVVDEATEIINL